MRSAALAAAVIGMVNHARVAHHLRPLRADHRLAVAASHWRGHHHGRGQPLRRVRRAGYRAWRASENLAWGQGLTPKAAVEAWLASPPHRANMLDPRVVATGVAITPDPYLGTVISQDFA